MSERAEVLVIGGGVIGASIADALAGDGREVHVIDRGRMGYGCSYGNAGWVTPSFGTPLPAPGTFWKSIGWMFDRESPLHIHPRPSLSLLSWLIRFSLKMRAGPYREGTRALTELSNASLAAYAALAQEFPDRVTLNRRGLLQVALGEEGLEAATADADILKELGIPGEVMTREEIRGFEPSLVGQVHGGVYHPGDADIEPLAAVQALITRAENRGARIHEHTEMIDIERGGSRAVRVRTTRGVFEADRVVLATGSWSSRIGRSLGLRIPILGGKGYALIVDPPTRMPRVPMMLTEKKVAVTPRAGSLRLAGTMEIVDGDESIAPHRVDAIYRGARSVFELPEQPQLREIWRGLRPCTPDGIPILGKAPAWDNLYVAAGHQMLGLQTAPASGRLIADLVQDRKPSFDPHPFRADRF